MTKKEALKVLEDFGFKKDGLNGYGYKTTRSGITQSIITMYRTDICISVYFKLDTLTGIYTNTHEADEEYIRFEGEELSIVFPL